MSAAKFKVDEAALAVALQKFQQTIALKAAQLGLSVQQCLKVEAGRLAETMLRITPPLDAAKTKENIKGAVTGKFKALNSNRIYHVSPGPSGLKWYAWSPTALYGVAEKYDLTNATVEGLRKIYYETKRNKEGRIVAGKRGKQTVYLWQNYQTDPKTVAALVKRLQGHVNRAKAGWLKGWLVLKSFGFKGSYNPSAAVTKHAQGARGYFINGLDNKKFPTFTLANTAKGIGSDYMRRIAHDALVIRTTAMVRRLTILTQHPERITQEF